MSGLVIYLMVYKYLLSKSGMPIESMYRKTGNEKQFSAITPLKNDLCNSFKEECAQLKV